ncbi:MAG TPA: hypothetical protein VFY87_26580 [Geminicoccaceae bacterium]|jgi:hypothetical protein|nr:hypothetical protein [Geminicoccaceae bacterium]
MRRTATRPGHPLPAALLALDLVACAPAAEPPVGPEGSATVRPRLSGGAGASGFTARVVVNATPVSPSGTRLAIRALNIGTYVNSFTGTPRQSTC